MRTKIFALILASSLPALTMNAQRQDLVVVQAASQQPATVAAAPATAASSSSPAALKALQDMKAVNDDVLKKQQATLEQLEVLQKAAEQLKIFSHRG